MKKTKEFLFKRLEKYPAGRPVQSILPSILARLNQVRREDYSKLPAIWEQLMGEKFAKMTQILKFQEGILQVQVKSATLYSLLSTEKKEFLLKKLQDSLPQMGIKNIVFRR